MMKKRMLKYNLYAPVLLLTLIACQREDPPVPDDSSRLVRHTIYATTPEEETPLTKTVVDVYNSQIWNILWSPKEFISIFSKGATGDTWTRYPFQGDNQSNAPSANFSGEGPKELGNYVALYPDNEHATYDGSYVNTTLPAIQTGKEGSFGDGYLITAAQATGNNISFKHVCSGLRFMVNRKDIKSVSIRGNNEEKIAGDFRFTFDASGKPVAEGGTETSVTLNAPGGVFEVGTYYYIVILPTNFSNGFTITADISGDSYIGELRFKDENFTAGGFKTITGDLETRKSWKEKVVKAQVYYGPENTICMGPGESITFDVSPRKIYGDWQRSGIVSSAAPVPNEKAVLWPVGSGTTASLSGSNLTITASSTPGSSLVAIKNGDTILWSYLIWVTNSAPAETTIPGGKILQETLGGELYFQWGRKDPLKEGSYLRIDLPITDNNLATSIQNPDKYINGSQNFLDWYVNDIDLMDGTLWGGDNGRKTVWDPCPSGWRVPSKSVFQVLNFETGAYGFSAIGYLKENAIRDDASKDVIVCWTSTPTDNKSKSYSLENLGNHYEVVSDTRDIAMPIRCVKE